MDASKSPADRNEYRLLRLVNGMRVLLAADLRYGSAQPADAPPSDGGSASDQALPTAAVALAVGVGSFADPPELPGCAHYLEHALFMGSTEFPDENDFDAYLSERGGYANAYTDMEETCYEVEVQAPHLLGALQRLASFIVSPALLPEAMQRELGAIEAEFQEAKLSDGARLSSIACELVGESSSASHPQAKFSWGNRASLESIPQAAGVDPPSLVRAFYEQHYTADIMHLVVSAPYPLDVLQEWVVPLFARARARTGTPAYGLPSPPPPGGLAPPVPEPTTSLTFEGAGRPLASSYQPTLTLVKSVRSRLKLHLQWPVPADVIPLHRWREAFRAAPDGLLSHLLGHESNGSVLHALKARGWAAGLSAGISNSGSSANSCCCWFDVTVSLTSAGMMHWHEVVVAVFEYISLLNQAAREDSGLKWAQDELVALAKLGYTWREEEEASEWVSLAASAMSAAVGDDEVVHLHSVPDLWAPAMLRQVLSCLQPAHVLVFLSCAKFAPEQSSIEPEALAATVGGADSESGSASDTGSGSGSDGESDSDSDDDADAGSSPVRCTGRRHRSMSESSAGSAESGKVDAAAGGGDIDPEALPHLPGAQLNRREKWFGTHFRTDPVPAVVLELWTAAWKGGSGAPAFPSLCLPSANPFIPGSFELVVAPPSEATTDPLVALDEMPALVTSADAVPVGGDLPACPPAPPVQALLEDTLVTMDSFPKATGPPLVRLPSSAVPLPGRPTLQRPEGLVQVADKCWSLPAARFGLPKACADFIIRLPQHGNSPLASLYTDIWTRYVALQLQDLAYHASLADLSLGLSSAFMGIAVSVRGFHDKLPELLQHATAALWSTPVVPEVMQTVLESMVRGIKNSLLRPADAATHHRLLGLLAPCQPLHERLAALEAVTPADVARFAGQELVGGLPAASSGSTDVKLDWTGAWVEGVIVGNASPDLARSMFQTVKASLPALPSAAGSVGLVGDAAMETPCAAVYCGVPDHASSSALPTCAPAGLIRSHVAALPRGSATVVHVPPRTPTARTCCVHKYFQVSLDHSLPAAAISALVAIMSEPLFDQLRTKQQLGYTVGCTGHSTDGVLGLSLTVQSSSATPQEVDEAMEAFFIDFRETLATMAPEAFQRVLRSASAGRLQVEANMHDLAGNVMVAVKRSKYYWASPNAEAAALARLTQSGILQLFDHVVAPGSRREFTAYVHAGAGAAAGTGTISVRAAGGASIPVTHVEGETAFQEWRQAQSRLAVHFFSVPADALGAGL